MPFDAIVNRFSQRRLVPFRYPDLATRDEVNLSPSTVYPLGTCLGQITTSANDVATVTVSGTPTAGTLTLTYTLDGVVNPVVLTMVAGSNVFPTNATIQSAVRALAIFAPGTVTITGTLGGAANGTIIVTYTGFLGFRPIPVVTSTNALTGGTPVVAIAHTTIGATAGQFAVYASGNSDGTQIWKACSEYDVATDSQGRITFGLVAGGGYHGETFLTASIWNSGHFRTEDLVGLDANAVTSAAARLLSGTVTTGEIAF